MMDGQYDAVALFLAGARRVCPGFGLAGQEGEVGRICRLVQGMPLALLLAAAWAEMLPPAEIADRIEEGIDFLEADWRDVPERHRSMRAVLDHSWSLLEEGEAEGFQALSVFCGGFGGEAARQVAGATLQDLRALVNRSLLYRTSTGRYEVHELLRQYAAEKLARSPAVVEAVHDGHSAYYAAALQRWAEDQKGARQLVALTEMDVEIDNARAAWDWAVAQGHVPWLDQALDGLARYYDWRVRYGEGETALQAAADRLQAASEGEGLRLRARILAWQGLITWRAGCTELANQRLEQSLALLKDPRLVDQDTRRERAFALYCSGYAVHDIDRETARDLCEQSVALYEALEDQHGLAQTLNILGEVILQLGAFEKAQNLLEASLGLGRALGDQRIVAAALLWLATALFYQGQAEEATSLLEESIPIYRKAGAPADLAFGLAVWGLWSMLLGRFEKARTVLAESKRIYDEVGVSTGHGNVYMSLMTLGMVETHLGNYRRARAELETALALCRETLWQRGIEWSLLSLGGVALAEGDHARALALLKDAAATSQAIKHRDDYGWALAIMAHVECQLDRLPAAQQHLLEALKIGMQVGGHPTGLYAVAGIALLLACRDDLERAVELYAMASEFPLVDKSHWFEDVAGRHIAAAAAALPPDTVTAAQARGRARDLKSTVAELLVELGGEEVPARTS